MRALGDSKRPLYFLLVASFLNIGLDLLCIIVFKMGVFGAAFATVFSQAVAGLGSLCTSSSIIMNCAGTKKKAA